MSCAVGSAVGGALVALGAAGAVGLGSGTWPSFSAGLAISAAMVDEIVGAGAALAAGAVGKLAGRLGS
jgi:hypothetical protein